MLDYQEIIFYWQQLLGKKNNNNEKKTIKTYKLYTKQIRNKYGEFIATEVLYIKEELQQMTLERKWKTVKEIINKAGAKLVEPRNKKYN